MVQQQRIKNLYPDENTRRQALFLLFYLPAGTYYVSKQQIEVGLQRATTSIEQASQYRQIISDLYPDRILNHEIYGTVDVRFYFYD